MNPVDQTAHVGFGSVEQLPSVLRALGARSILLFTGRTSFAASGAEAVLCRSLAACDVHRASHAGGPPQLDAVRYGVAELRACTPDVVVAVGGGSVLDMAKLVALFANQPAGPEHYVTGGRSIEAAACPLVALPTTAGSGSEATHFAVVYSEKRKYSVAHPSLLPRAALVDPQFTMNLTPPQTAIPGIDALSQAIESYWSVNSTDESRSRSRRAIRLVLEHLPEAVRQPDRTARAGVAEAAFLAGQAINVARTTAPHAVSYGMTAWFGVPHGQAVAITLPHFFAFNAEVTDADVADRRGAAFVRRMLDELNELLGTRSAIESRQRLQAFIRQVGLATRLDDVGVSSPAARQRVLECVNAERLTNNPRVVTPRQLADLFAQV